MSMATKMSIALKLAYALLELHSSPWLPLRLDKRDINFWVDDYGAVIADYPFLISLAGTEDGHPVNPLLSLGSLDVNAQDLGDKGLTLAVYRRVISELEMFVAMFEL